MTEFSLINKYRPISLDEVIGHTEIVKSLKEALSTESRHHTYLLSGPAGCGKTSIARIIAKNVGATIYEVDVGTHSGIEDVRQLVEMSGYKPLTGQNLCYILDEVHALSKQAWSGLLKLAEEPPLWIYICLATTELQKVPDTIKSRSYHIPLKLLRSSEIEDLVATVAELEGWKVTGDVFNAIIQAAEGSPRKALSILQAGHSIATRDELAQIISNVESNKSPIIELCNLLIRGNKNWRQISSLVGKIDDFEESSEIACRYLTGAMQRSEEDQAHMLWLLVNAFAEAKSWDKKVNFYSAVGKILWGTIPF